MTENIHPNDRSSSGLAINIKQHYSPPRTFNTGALSHPNPRVPKTRVPPLPSYCQLHPNTSPITHRTSTYFYSRRVCLHSLTPATLSTVLFFNSPPTVLLPCCWEGQPAGCTWFSGWHQGFRWYTFPKRDWWKYYVITSCYRFWLISSLNCSNFNCLTIAAMPRYLSLSTHLLVILGQDPAQTV